MWAGPGHAGPWSQWELGVLIDGQLNFKVFLVQGGKWWVRTAGDAGKLLQRETVVTAFGKEDVMEEGGKSGL